MIKKILLILLACTLFVMMCGCSNATNNSPYTLLNESDIQSIESIIKKEINENVTSINLFGNSKGLPYIQINFLDNSSICYSLDGNQYNNGNNDYEVFVTTTLTDNLPNTIELLCGNYNQYFLLRETAESEFGDDLAFFYYDNFFTENPCYEAIVSEKTTGQLFVIGDDCILSISEMKEYYPYSRTVY